MVQWPFQNRRLAAGQAFLFAAAVVAGQVQGAGADDSLILVAGGTLIDGTLAPPRTGLAILIRNGRIAAIDDAADARVPQGTEILDASGKYIVPGFADMHVHFGTGGLVPRDSLTVDRVLRQFLYYGVTTVLNLGGTGGSLDDIQTLRRRIAEGTVAAPHVYATGGLLTVPGGHPVATIMRPPEGTDPSTQDWVSRGVWLVNSPEEVRAVIERLAEHGMDGVKIVIESGAMGRLPSMSPAMVAAAVDAAGTFDMKVFAHATSPDELQVAVQAGVHAIVHSVHDAPVSADLLAAMRHHRIHFVPTLSIFIWADAWGDPADTLTDPFLRSGVERRVIESLLASPLAPGEPPTESDWAGRRQALQALRAFHRAGVPIATGSDSANPFVFPGFSLHHELALLVEGGLSPMDAIVAATRRPAEMLGLEHEFGTIEPGKRADLLILGADPLEDIQNTRNIQAVIRGGEVIDRLRLLAVPSPEGERATEGVR